MKLTKDELDACIAFAHVLMDSMDQESDRRGDMLQTVADELLAKDQNFTADLFSRMANRYNNGKW